MGIDSPDKSCSFRFHEKICKKILVRYNRALIDNTKWSDKVEKMKILKENPIILIWLLILTGAVIFSLFHVRVTVNLHAPEDAKTSVTTSKGQRSV